MVLSWKNFPIKKYRGEGFLAKNAVFCYFSCPLRKKFQVAANRTILILEGLPMAHLKAYIPLPDSLSYVSRGEAIYYS